MDYKFTYQDSGGAQHETTIYGSDKDDAIVSFREDYPESEYAIRWIREVE